MEAERFDRWTKALIAGASRRNLLRGVAGGVLAGSFPRWGAAKERRELGDPCKHHRQCPRTSYCQNRRCECLATETACGGLCYDLDTNDGAHCGACGAACPAGHSCIRRVCTPHGTVPRGSECARTADCIRAGGPVICTFPSDYCGGGASESSRECVGIDQGPGRRASCTDDMDGDCECAYGTKCKHGKCQRV